MVNEEKQEQNCGTVMTRGFAGLIFCHNGEMIVENDNSI
ncbi:hypothetical protein C8R31_10320 [Nitrosospira sp. Nsp2]|nr:hypothetical protein C8R31_10320 [Nitrosospira sp. Nsp2]